MKKLILSMLVLLASPAFAGRSVSVLTCTGPALPGFQPMNVQVFYEVKSGPFGGFLGFSAQEQAINGDIRAFF